MLLYKAWLESRLRFYIALVALTSVGVLYVCLHPLLVPGWIIALKDPSSLKPPWLAIGIYEYRFYIWHFLYDYQFQEGWALFALVLSTGGLNQESHNGSIFFTLSLPVKRSSWIWSRFTLTLLQAITISVIPSFVVSVFSKAYGLNYAISQALAHALLLAFAGSFFIGMGMLLSVLLRAGFYLSMVVTLLGIGLPYMFIQEYVRNTTHGSLLYHLDLSHVMAGPWLLTWSNLPWTGMLVSGALTSLLLIAAVTISKRYDY